MSVKKNNLSPLLITLLISGILFVALPVLGLSPIEMIFVGLINILTFLVVYFEKFKLFFPFIKMSVSIFNIIVFGYQIYGALTFSNVGYSLNVVFTMLLSVLFLIAYVISILYYSNI
ncbi:MAG: hypothetical protein ABSB40_06815 [Nitrososphaeria archaeon]|jgi:hypothetical protein